MSIVKKLSMVAAIAASIALGTYSTAPATAALLDFSFTTESGGTASFTLDTDAAPNPNPALLGPPGGPFTDEGVAYPGAVSNFSISTLDVSLSNVTAEYSVFPSIPVSPDNTRVDSSINFPSGCITATDFSCSIGVFIDYAGNVSELPVLSDDPASYPAGFSVTTLTA